MRTEDMSTEYFIVWNKEKTSGFVTTDQCIAYEARKGAYSNCYNEDGEFDSLGGEFCNVYSRTEDCSIEMTNLIGVNKPMTATEVRQKQKSYYDDLRFKEVTKPSYTFTQNKPLPKSTFSARKPIRTKECSSCGIYKLVLHGNLCLTCEDKMKRVIKISGYILVLICFLLLVTGCGTTARVSALHDYQNEIEGGNPIMIVQIEKELTDDLSCGYTHISHLLAGRPFNKREEDVADALSCTVRLW